MQQTECKNIAPKGIHTAYSDDKADNGINPRKITATTIIGNRVINPQGKELGKIEEIVIDLTCGIVSYVVISSGGFAGIGDKFFAVPLDALTFNMEDKTYSLKVDKKVLKKSPGFDKHNWPEQAEWPVERP